MPQLIEFPRLLGEAGSVIQAMAKVCREVSASDGFPELRDRLRVAKLWDRENPLPLLRFLGMKGAYAGPTEVMKRFAASDDLDAARDVATDRLWAVNPLLFRTVLMLLTERPAMRDELYKFLGSAHYKGKVPSRPELDNWIDLALDAGIIRRLGIAVALHERVKRVQEQVDIFEAEEFLALDKPDPEPELPRYGEASPEPAAAAASAEPAAASAPATAAGAQGPPLPRWMAGAEPMPSPRKRSRPVPIARFAGAEVFSNEVLAETVQRIGDWWKEVNRPSRAYRPEDFGFDPEAWVERADELLYHTAVAAALVFRLDAEPRTFRALEESGVLADLYQGTMPEELPANVDPRTLTLAALVARRFSEAAGVAAELEQKMSAAELFTALETLLGRGLFRVELHWILGMLARLGVIRHDDLADYTALPYRLVRDTLFRLGFLTSPYAHDAAGLAAAAKAARRAAGGAEPADEVVASFALAAGCAYECPHRRSCEYACRERLE